MMRSLRPYLTVILDSFHEAMASRVLWILLAVLSIVLLALVPVSVREHQPTRLRISSVDDWTGLFSHIKQQADAPEPSPGKRIWQLADAEVRKAIDAAHQEDGRVEPTRDQVLTVLNGLNELAEKVNFYDEAAFRGIQLKDNAKLLLNRGFERLSGDERMQLNRMLLASAFHAQMASLPDQEIRFYYLHWGIGTPLPITKDMTTTIIKRALSVIMGVFLGTIGVFVAILVTAPIVPRTFEAGSVDLLMSKPVSRSLLFLAKFIGGCAFILLNAGYFIVGLWLIVGWRFGLWSSNLLLCIPLFLFLFSIYYCVSTLAGVWWKNPIVSVVITIVFWAVCFAVGTTKGVIEQLFIDPYRIVKIVPAGEALLAVNQSAEIVEWRGAAENLWEEVLDDESDRPQFASNTIVGPVYDASRNELTYIELPPPVRGFAFLAAQPTLVRAALNGVWERREGPAPPGNASWLFLNPQNEIILVAADGVFRLDESAAAERNVLGVKLPFGGKNPYVPLTKPLNLKLSPPFAAAMDDESGDLLLYNSSQLTLLRRQADGTFQLAVTRAFPEQKASAAVALNRAQALVAFSDGLVLLMQREDLKTLREFRPAGKNEPYTALAAPGSRYLAVLFHNRTLWLLDTQQNSTRKLGRDVSAAVFSGPDTMLIADRGQRVTEYDLASMKKESVYQPEPEVLDLVYRYAVMPFYKVFPKPGELGNVVSYLLTEQETLAIDGSPGQTDLRERRVKIDVWGPIWSSLAFVVAVLAVTCFYLRRADL